MLQHAAQVTERGGTGCCVSPLETRIPQTRPGGVLGWGVKKKRLQQPKVISEEPLGLGFLESDDQKLTFSPLPVC